MNAKKLTTVKTRTIITITVTAYFALGSLPNCYETRAAEPTSPVTIIPDALGGDKLSEDWTRTVEIPPVMGNSNEVMMAGSRLMFWVERGWLVVKQETLEKEFEWQVVLARADATQPPPAVDIAKPGGSKPAGLIEIKYGKYYILERLGALRMLRERKIGLADAWPQLSLDPKRQALGEGGEGALLYAWQSDGWCWVAGGLKDKRLDLRVRLQPVELMSAPSFAAQLTPAEFRSGEAHARDDGAMFVADRIPSSIVPRMLRVKRLKEELVGKPAPRLVVKEWLNIPEPLRPRGKVLLLDFWGRWCRPCVEKLPALEALHAKYRNRGLVVIGIHTAQGSENLEAFLRDKKVTFPVGVDTGETEKRYGIHAWPTCFLVDRAENIAWGFQNALPAEKQIEELLNQEEPGAMEARNPVQITPNGQFVVTHVMHLWKGPPMIFSLEDRVFKDMDKVVARIGELMKQKPFPYIRLRVGPPAWGHRQGQKVIKELSDRCTKIGFSNLEFRYDLTEPPKNESN